ncbi:MAG: tyrosine-type recombinase/integrase [Candidatus Diapherotrites archaeon]
MENRIDIHNYRKRLNCALSWIKSKAKLTPANRTLLLKWYECLVNDGLTVPRMEKLVSQVCRIGEWLEKDFEKAGQNDIERIVSIIQSNQKYADWTKHDYKVTVKKFWKWLNGNKELPEIVKWVSTRMGVKNRMIPEELLTEEEVLKLIDCCDHPRDKALTALLYETGARIGEIGSIRLKHLTFNGCEGQVVLNGKTGMRKVFIVTSVPFLKKWIELHPRRKDKEAPLFVRITSGKGQAMTYAGIKKILGNAMKKSGVNKKYNPHLFRHSRATYLAGYLTESQLNYVMGWIQGSEMAATYVHLNGKEVNDALRRMYGLGEEKKLEESKFISRKCPICNTMNEPKAELCCNCSNPLTYKAAIKKFQKTEDERFEEILKELFWEKFRNQFKNTVSPEEAKQLIEEAEEKARRTRESESIAGT